MNDALTVYLEATREDDRQRILLPLELKLEKAMMHAFEMQEKKYMRLFRGLRHLWPEPEIREALEPRDWEPLFDAVELATIRLFEEPLTEIQRAAIEAGARAAIADVGLGLSFSLEHPEAVRYLQQAAIKVASINETTREEVRRILIKGVEEGWSYDRVARELQAKWESFRVPAPQQHIRSRAHLVAVTEMGDAYVQGNLIVGRDLKRAGLRMEKRALDVGDERECPICQSNAAEDWIPIDQAFSSGHDAPTFHPSCRCDVEQRAVFA